MDTAEFFVKGLIVGFLVAAPVGPVAVMCIHRTIAHGRLAGYVCGLGATLVDTIFGAIAALGLGFVATELIAHQDLLRLVGGAILCGLGVKLILARHLPPRAERQEEREEREERLAPMDRGGPERHIGDFATAFAVTITNPITLISFAAIFAAIDISDIKDYTRWVLSLVTGVFVGAGLWWSFLVMVSGLFRHRIGEDDILLVNRVSGAFILAFGAILLVYPGTSGAKDHAALLPRAVFTIPGR